MSESRHKKEGQRTISRFVIPYKALNFSAKEKVEGIFRPLYAAEGLLIGGGLGLAYSIKHLMQAQSNSLCVAGAASITGMLIGVGLVNGCKNRLELFRDYIANHQPYDNILPIAINELRKSAVWQWQREDVESFLDNRDDWQRVRESCLYFHVNALGWVVMQSTPGPFSIRLPDGSDPDEYTD